MDSEKQGLENAVQQTEDRVDSASTSEEKQAIVKTAVSDGTGHIKYAGFWMRFWAYILDLVVIGSLNGIIIYPIFRMFDFPLNGSSMFAPISIVTAVTFYVYFVLMTKFFNQTIGKMVFGLRVVTIDNKKPSWSTILFREWIGRFISGTIFILYIVVAFLPKKQGIHDLFANTTVIHEQ